MDDPSFLTWTLHWCPTWLPRVFNPMVFQARSTGDPVKGDITRSHPILIGTLTQCMKAFHRHAGMLSTTSSDVTSYSEDVGSNPDGLQNADHYFHSISLLHSNVRQYFPLRKVLDQLGILNPLTQHHIFPVSWRISTPLSSPRSILYPLGHKVITRLRAICDSYYRIS